MTDPISPTPPAPPAPIDPAGPYLGPPPTPDERTMAMLAHLLSIFTHVFGPLIVWLLQKDKSRFVDDQGKEAINFQLTLLIGYVIGAMTACLIVGYFVLLACWACGIVFGILAAVEANKGVAYRYPFSIRVVT